MTKPTAQELWERIEEEINLVYYDDKHGDGGCLLNHIKLYAKAYHEEHTQSTIIKIEDKLYTATLTPYNPNQ